jgi:hypothetical protein
MSTWFLPETLCVSGAGGKPLRNGGPPEARQGFQWARSIGWAVAHVGTKGIEKRGDVVRGGWADVARRLPARSSVWVTDVVECLYHSPEYGLKDIRPC